MKITLLGTGTPTPSTKRKSSGYMVEIGADVVLFDHGPGAYQRMLETGMRPPNTGNLLSPANHSAWAVAAERMLTTRADCVLTSVCRVSVVVNRRSAPSAETDQVRNGGNRLQDRQWAWHYAESFISQFFALSG